MRFVDKVNAGEHVRSRQAQKYCLKLVRIFTGTSQFVDKHFVMRNGLQSVAMKNLEQDVQFTGLNAAEQQFVRQTVRRVCDYQKKPVFKSVAVFLNSPNSESTTC